MNEKDFLFSLTGEKIKTLMNTSPNWRVIYLDNNGEFSLYKRINTGNGYKDYDYIISRELITEVFNKHPKLHEERIKSIETDELKILKSFETYFEIKSKDGDRKSITNVPLKNELVNNLFKEIDTIIVIKEPYINDPHSQVFHLPSPLLGDRDSISIVGKWIQKYISYPSMELECEVYKGKINKYGIHYLPCSDGYCDDIYYFKFNEYDELISYLENLKIQIDIFTILKANKNKTSIMIEKYEDNKVMGDKVLGDKVFGDKKQETNMGDKMINSVKAGRDVSDVAISSNKNKSNIVNGVIITVIGGIILLLIKYYFHLI